jgi:hypothetical protein
MGKVNESEAKAIVVKYLTNQNRPYSVNDLVANLHNEVPKALMQKTLDGLVEESKIKEKVNGKQKVNLSRLSIHSFSSNAYTTISQLLIMIINDCLNFTFENKFVFVNSWH